MIDEEQRFGAAEKAHLRRLGAGLHVLTLTATPIPRTLQAARWSGLQDLSVIATPPALRLRGERFERRVRARLKQPLKPAQGRRRRKSRIGKNFCE